MSPPRFVPWPDPVLRTPAAAVQAVDDSVRRVWEDMLDAMYAMPGIGLAAPQIGLSLRLAVVDAGWERGGPRAPIRLANPEIASAATTLREVEEASPNLPGISAPVKRPDWVRVRYLDDTGSPVERLFEGLWATSVQHQIDHLQGRVYLDRLGEVKRSLLVRKLKKLRGGR